LKICVFVNNSRNLEFATFTVCLQKRSEQEQKPHRIQPSETEKDRSIFLTFLRSFEKKSSHIAMANHDDLLKLNLDDILYTGPFDDLKCIRFDDNFTFNDCAPTSSGTEMTKGQLSNTACSTTVSPKPADIRYDFVDLTESEVQTTTKVPKASYNLSDRQLRHSNQSAGSYFGVPMSYAELITIAIESSPDKRLLLSEIYQWMTENVPEFVDPRLPPSETSWKNSIRHNLSLHNKFVKEGNPENRKGSYWTLGQVASSKNKDRRDSGISTASSSRRCSANLADSIKQFHSTLTNTDEFLPRVADQLGRQHCSSFSGVRKMICKRNGSQGKQEIPATAYKRRRNTICSGSIQRPLFFNRSQGQGVLADPNATYLASACQDVQKVANTVFNTNLKTNLVPRAI